MAETKRIVLWFKRAWPRWFLIEHWLTLMLVVAFVALFVLDLMGYVRLYAGDTSPDGANRFYLLSALAQTLGAIAALVVTATLVATQLAAQSFTPRAVRYRLHDPWLWWAIGIYLGAISLSLGGIAAAKGAKGHLIWDWWSVEVALLLGGAALAYLVPFTVAVLRSLETESFVRELLRGREYSGLEDFTRKAINEGLVGQTQMALSMLGGHAQTVLRQNGGSLDDARRFASLGVKLGRYAATEKDPEAIIVAMNYLTDMTTYCTDSVYRAAADVFNESVVELQNAAEEVFGQ